MQCLPGRVGTDAPGLHAVGTDPQEFWTLLRRNERQQDPNNTLFDS